MSLILLINYTSHFGQNSVLKPCIDTCMGVFKRQTCTDEVEQSKIPYNLEQIKF